MDVEYKLEVCLTPHEHDNKEAPYFWCLFKYGNDWANEGFGWAKTPEEAFKDGMDYATKYMTSRESSV